MSAPLDPSLRPSLARRGAAFALDALLLTLLLVASQLAFQAALGDRLDGRLDTGFDVYRWSLLTVSVPAWSYFVLTESLWRATPGKRALGLRVRDVTRGEPSVDAVFRRTAVKLLPFELVHLGVLLPTPLWRVEEPSFRWALLLGDLLLVAYAALLLRSGARQGPWDRAAGTVVVRAA